MTSTPVAVVGAGPYGLSVAAHLRAGGIDHRAFGRPMSMWTDHMPRGMFLKSEGHASNLSDPFGASTLSRFAREQGRPYADLGEPVSLELFVDYGRWFQHREVPHVETLDVVSIVHSGDRFRLDLSDRTIAIADRVVLATGFGAFGHVPAEIAGLPEDLVTHSSAHDDLTRLAGQEVIVVGAGQSALETAALLAAAGARPHLVVRGRTVYWNSNPAGRPLASRLRHPVSRLGPGWRLLACDRLPAVYHHLPERTRVDIARRALGPAGAWWLRNRLDGAVPMTLTAEIRSARSLGDAVELTVQTADGETTLRADHLVAGTGYRVDLGRLHVLDADLRRRITTVSGYPRLDRHFESSVPGLHFVGLPAAASFGPVQRFVCGTGFAARSVAATLSTKSRAQRLRRTPEPSGRAAHTPRAPRRDGRAVGAPTS